MKKIKFNFPVWLILPILSLCFVFNSYAQVSKGVGNMIAGDLWNAIWTPGNGGSTYAGTGENTYGVRYWVFGNYDRAWTNPNGYYPHSFPWTNWWTPSMHGYVFDNDTTFNPKTIGGKTNYSFFANSAGRAGAATWSYYAPIAHRTTMDGGKDPNRTYSREAAWTDPTRRQHLIHETGFVTNVGIDVKTRAHQFASPNWNNLNDFILLEISMKNTGNVDMDGDGVFEKTNHKIQGVQYTFYPGNYCPTTTSDVHGRRGSSWGPNSGRMEGYIGDADPNGDPWAFAVHFSGNSVQSPTAGNFDMGLAPFASGFYTDIWYGNTWAGAKKGGLPADPEKGTGIQPDKQTVFGTHAIGQGPQRGWYLSMGSDQALSGITPGNPKASFIEGNGVWYQDGGKSDQASTKYFPNPKFFASGTADDITTWVPKTTNPTEAERPNGDRKLSSLDPGVTNAIYQSTEDGTMDKKADGTPIPYPTGWGKLSKGVTIWYNFDGAFFSGIGPFSLDVNEEMTITLVLTAGYRLEGVQKSIRAARWAYDNGLAVPVTPAVPDIKISNTTKPTVNVEWDNKAESDPQFSAYKIWRSCQFIKYKWLDYGFRIIDRFQEQEIPGDDRTPLKKPVNPKFDAFKWVTTRSTAGEYPGYYFGTWELVKNIKKSELAPYKNPVTPGYTYLFEDKNVVLGGSYWYYISAVKDGTFTGPGGETTSKIETHYINRNGASGLWEGTYPYATGNSFYPVTADGKKKMGATQIVNSALRSTDELKSGKYEIGVRPNPYKRAALHDNFLQTWDHKLLFYNLPPSCKITITDVAGQIVQELKFASSDPTLGSMFWDMFSKDGMEVASGLYLYFVEYDGGTYSGKFSILR